MALGDGDLQAMLGDFGVDVTLGPATVKGIVDSPDAEYLAGHGSALVAASVVVTVVAGSLPGLKVGVEIVADGETYHVRKLWREVSRRVDTKLQHIECSRR